MRRAVFILLIAGCAESPTSLLLSLFSSASLPKPPAALSVSIWDKHGPLTLGRTARGQIPGTLLVTNLPDVTQELRIGLADADTNMVVMGFRADITAHTENRQDVHLDGTTDADGDGVPDNIDDCPTVPNREQRDGDGDGTGDSCANFDLGKAVVDLRGADLTPPPCNALFCDNFDTDLIPGNGRVTTAGGTPLWTVYDSQPNAFVEIQFGDGALGSAQSVRVRFAPDLMDAGTVLTYQRYEGGIDLYSGVPNYTRILTGPTTYMRFFAKLSRPPTDFYSPSVTLGYVTWGSNPTDNVELDARPDGIEFNDRYSFVTRDANTNVLAVDWVGAWVCVEWKHELVAGDGGATDYHATVSVNGMAAGTFQGSGVPNVFGAFTLGADAEFRPDVPTTTDFTEYFDEVKFSDQPIGCN